MSVENVEAGNLNAESHGERPPQSEVPREFGDYELLEEVGRGGQGVVFRAWQKSLNRTVAVKIIGIGQLTTSAHLKRLRREAAAAAKLNHPGIVPVYEVGERDGTYYFSMRFVEGDCLDEVVSRGSISVRQAAELVAKVARTVHYAHEHGILHRDIKPGNILLDANGEPHLTDFGLARLVESGSTVTGSLEVMGTPSYMAPEQAVGNNAELSRATDVYGLGAVLYELLTGHPPFAGGTTYETIHLLLDSEPRQPRLWNPKVDRDLSAVCLKCLEKNPRYRYSSALELAEDLERWLRHEPIRAKRSGFFTRARKWVQRNRIIAALILLSLILAAVLSVMIWERESVRRIPAGIAVLPFENLSDNTEDAFFADGVQDDILTKLAKIADLKVISRTSVMHYRGKRDLRQIGRSLGVSHVLEGTARRSGSKVHVNAQLVDTRTNTGVWADGYERDLKEAFAVPSEIAQKVADQLQAKISTAEKLDIERKPTADLTAFELYAQARTLLLMPIFSATGDANLVQAVDLLNQAVARDPSFFQAYCQLAYAHDLLYFLGSRPYPLHAWGWRKQPSRQHLVFFQMQEKRTSRAPKISIEDTSTTPALWPNWKLLLTPCRMIRGFSSLKGYIQRRQGRWEDAKRNLERAADLDPRNVFILRADCLELPASPALCPAETLLDRVLTIEPDNLETKAARAFVELDWKADTRPLHQLINQSGQQIRAARKVSPITGCFARWPNAMPPVQKTP